MKRNGGVLNRRRTPRRQARRLLRDGGDDLHLATADRLLWLEDHHAAAGTAPAPERLSSGIDIRELSFRYPGTERQVLSSLTLTLPAGATVAIVGENGSGKTTLVKLLTRCSSCSTSRRPPSTRTPSRPCSSGTPRPARSGTITLLVSHRFAAVRMADLIVYLEEGHAAEAGTHESCERWGISVLSGMSVLTGDSRP
jgi:ABC-type multidrug transport system fused ATPase/permease subunit